MLFSLRWFFITIYIFIKEKAEMKINQIILSIALVVIVAGTIITTKVLGIWVTTTTKIPVTYQSGEFKGQYDPSDIRGSYSFGDISDLFNVPLEDLGKAFAVESNFSSFLCKDLEAIYVLASADDKEVGTDSVSIFVALYKGLPITLSDTSYLPDTASEILLSKGKMTEDQKTFLASHLVKPEKPSIESTVSTATSTESENFVKGKTTFKEVLAIGVKKEAIESVLGKPIGDTSSVIKTFCEDNGLEFSVVKVDIQKLIDEK
jgi:hypothetical protein